MTSDLSQSAYFAKAGQLNHKVRHLDALCIRNINLDPPTGRSRGTTIDDEALPYALKSPVKFLAESERKQLAHTRSFENLRQVPDTSENRASLATEGHKAPASPHRPKKSRRKSTLEWSNTSPAERHDSLRKAVERKSADVFFSLHVNGADEPVYISEVVEHATNPDFRSFDLRACSPSISRRDQLMVRVWVKANESWQLLIDSLLDFSSLHLVGKAREHIQDPLPDNCLVLSFPDGIYTSDKQSAKAPPSASSSATIPQPTSSYDALLRLATIDERIQDAIATRERLTADINKLINDDQAGYSDSIKSSLSNDDVTRVEKAVISERHKIESLRTKLQVMRNEHAARSEAMAGGRITTKKYSQDLQSDTPQFEESRLTLSVIHDATTEQRRRICSALATIYPIEPVFKRPLAFTIRGIHLPNADFTNVDETRVSAALGHVAHLVLLLSLYLSVALPYPILPSSSTSTIKDPISIMTGSRIFPLYMPHAILYRFEYGVFLLNKDIELVANKLGLRLIDIRQTLPNLKYILVVVTTGKGQAPVKKPGVGTEVLRGIKKDTPDDSRRSSFDSEGPGQSSLREQLPAMVKAQNGSAIKSK